MPEFIVSSGDFNVRIKRRSARRAALDAIGLLKTSDEDIHLGLMVGVCGVDSDDFIYLSTIVLMEENGINFKFVGGGDGRDSP